MVEKGVRMGDSPARLYAGVVGATLVIAGIIGFFYSASFGSPGEVDAVFGIFDVNAWQNLVHIGTGLLGLAAFSAGAYASRTYAIGIGLVYIVVAVWGFVIGDGESVLGFVPISTEDNVLHALIGVGGLAAGFATPRGRALPLR
jgi:hypothetical protein